MPLKIYRGALKLIGFERKNVGEDGQVVLIRVVSIDSQSLLNQRY